MYNKFSKKFVLTILCIIFFSTQSGIKDLYETTLQSIASCSKSIYQPLSNLEQKHHIPYHSLKILTTAVVISAVVLCTIAVNRFLHQQRLDKKPNNVIISSAEQKLAEALYNFDDFFSILKTMHDVHIDPIHRLSKHQQLCMLIKRKYEISYPFSTCVYHVKYTIGVLNKHRGLIERRLFLINNQLQDNSHRNKLTTLEILYTVKSKLHTLQSSLEACCALLSILEKEICNTLEYKEEESKKPSLNTNFLSI